MIRDPSKCRISSSSSQAMPHPSAQCTRMPLLQDLQQTLPDILNACPQGISAMPCGLVSGRGVSESLWIPNTLVGTL